MKTRNIIAFAIVALLLIGSVSAYAQRGMEGPHGQMGPGMCHPGMAIAEQLELTSEQIKQFREMQVATKKKLIPLQANIKLAKLELHELLRNDASGATLDRKIEEIGSIRTNMQKIKIKEKAGFRSILTDKQKEKLDTMPMGEGPGCHHGQGRRMMKGDCMPYGAGNPGAGYGQRPGRSRGLSRGGI